MNLLSLRFLLGCILIYLFQPSVLAQQKKMCLTIDDLPVVNYGENDPSYLKEVTEGIISTMKKQNVPAIGYVNEGKCYSGDRLDNSKVDLLRSWVNNGLELGNHTYSHTNYHKVSLDSFRVQILKGEMITRKLMKDGGMKLMYFRHPYLRVGQSEAHADSLSMLLRDLGYIAAPVTVDNEDYLFAKAYHIAWKKNDYQLMEQIGNTYVEYMQRKVLYFEHQSVQLFDRPIHQTLLVHASLLNAHYLDKLIDECKKLDYDFVSQTEILRDEAYQTPITYFGDWGISWIDRWALSQGKRGDFFKGDPETPEFIHEVLNTE